MRLFGVFLVCLGIKGQVILYYNTAWKRVAGNKVHLHPVQHASFLGEGVLKTVFLLLIFLQMIPRNLLMCTRCLVPAMSTRCLVWMKYYLIKMKKLQTKWVHMWGANYEIFIMKIIRFSWGSFCKAVWLFCSFWR